MIVEMPGIMLIAGEAGQDKINIKHVGDRQRTSYENSICEIMRSLKKI